MSPDAIGVATKPDLPNLRRFDKVSLTFRSTMPAQISYGDNLIAPYRVLDLTDDKGVFCTKLLAD